MRISKSVMTVGGVVLAAALIGFTNPKTVHAVAAALVQVTNTASNPVVTQGVGQQAGQMIHIACYEDGRGSCVVANLARSSAEPYVVPSGQSLVVTAVDIFPAQPGNLCSTVHFDGLYSSNGGQSGYSQLWLVYNTTMHMGYPSGIVFTPGTSFMLATGYYANTPAACTAEDDDQVDLYGYLTAS